MNFLQSNALIKRLLSYALAITVVLSGCLFFSTPAKADTAQDQGVVESEISLGGIVSGLEGGLKEIGNLEKEVQDIIKGLFPPEAKGAVAVLNALNEPITVRSYNNNDWIKAIASEQIILKPNGGIAKITAVSDPVALIWKRGEISELAPLGYKHISQTVVPKSTDKVFIITNNNTID